MNSKEEIQFQKRLQDMANRVYSRGIPVFTDFLSISEISILHTMKNKLAGIRYETYGGYEFAERQIAMFVPDALFYDGYEEYPQDDYPIVTLKIDSIHKKFAEKLTHRDYLGALIGLGVERSQIGDIVVMEHCAYAFCHTGMAEFFQKELVQVRNTAVKTTVTTEEVSAQLTLQELTGTVPSLRADAVTAMVYKYSRNHALELFRGQKIFINGRLTESGSQQLKEGDIVSVRGLGRFVFTEVLSVTKKDRYCIQIKKY